MVMRATCPHEVCDTCSQEEGSLQQLFVPKIDRLEDVTSRHTLLMFMDAYISQTRCSKFGLDNESKMVKGI